MERLMIKLCFIIMVISVLLKSACCQNLIRNPGFEMSYSWMWANGAKGWHEPGMGSTDIFTEQITRRKKARSGKSFAGLVVKSESLPGERYNEYLQASLKEPLQKSQLYCLSFYVKWKEKYKYTANCINVSVRKKRIYSLKTKINLKNFYSINTIETNDVEWHELSLIFKANGGERFIAFGAFSDSVELIPQESITFRGYPMAYYYFDDFSLIPIADSIECPCYTNKREEQEKDVTSIEIKNNQIINKIKFKFDDALLTDSAKDELNQVVDYLKRNKKIKLEIHGYTDSLGTDSYNLELSKGRALSVYNYLISKGISAKRLSYFGYGSAIPNKNGRKSRRVELIIKK